MAEFKATRNGRTCVLIALAGLELESDGAKGNFTPANSMGIGAWSLALDPMKDSGTTAAQSRPSTRNSIQGCIALS
jgi:hypothetical protein